MHPTQSRQPSWARLPRAVIFLSLGILVWMATNGSVLAQNERKRTQEDDGKDAEGSIREFKWEVALGHDTNVYRAPSTPYLTGPGGTVVYPATESGAFAMADLSLWYFTNAKETAALAVGLEGNGDFYLDSAQTKANVYDTQITLGRLHRLGGSGARSDELFYGIYRARNKENYIDRDSGNIIAANKYSYSAEGVEVDYETWSGKDKYQLTGFFEARDYDTPAVGSEYDHDYLRLYPSALLRVADAMKLKVGYIYANRAYSLLAARDKTTANLSTTPRNLTYHTLVLGMHNNLPGKWRLYLDYFNTNRVDAYQGYGDYTQHRGKARVKYGGKDQLEWELEITRSYKDYPNAFAYENTLAPKLNTSYTNVNTVLSIPLGKNLTNTYGLEYRDADSSDHRYDYERGILTVGLKGEF